jgi:hypothetical protein
MGIILSFDNYDPNYKIENIETRVEKVVSFSNILFHNKKLFEYLTNPNTNLVDSDKLSIKYNELPLNVLQLVQNSYNIANEATCSEDFTY